jgi:hypothetical protein
VSSELNSLGASAVGDVPKGLNVREVWELFRSDRDGYIHPLGITPHESERAYDGRLVPALPSSSSFRPIKPGAAGCLMLS